LLDNLEYLAAGFSLDRQKYITGERATEGIRITNNTQVSREIHDPASPKASGFSFGFKGGFQARAYGEEWSMPQTMPHPYLDAPSVSVPPSQGIQLTVNSDDPRPDGVGDWFWWQFDANDGRYVQTDL
jgi:hypothetical protein